MPNVLIFSAGEDTGGVGVGISRAFAGNERGWSVRFVRRANNYIHYPVDIEWIPGDEATGRGVTSLWEKADIIHSFQKWITMDGWTQKRKVIHHHGTAFRKSPEAWIVEADKHHAISICSTIDIMSHAPDRMIWVPNPYDLDFLVETRKRCYHPTRKLRIAHAPTNRLGKSTNAFMAACERLSKEIEIEVDLIERTTWAECLERKARADIYYDQVLVAYGNNAIEAWGMGIPVVAGVNPDQAAAHGIPVPDRTRDEMLKMWGSMPFVEASESSIYEALRLLADPTMRAEYSNKGLEHVRKWHDARKVMEQLISIYEAAT